MISFIIAYHIILNDCSISLIIFISLKKIWFCMWANVFLAICCFKDQELGVNIVHLQTNVFWSTDICNNWVYTFMSRSWNKVVTIFLITIFEISGRKLILVIERNLIHEQQGIHMMAHFAIIFFNHEDIYTPHNEVVGGYTGFTMSIRLSVRL